MKYAVMVYESTEDAENNKAEERGLFYHEETAKKIAKEFYLAGLYDAWVINLETSKRLD